MGFLLTVSLIVSAGLASFGHFLGGLLPAQELILHVIDFALSFGIITLLFAAMYRSYRTPRLSGVTFGSAQ
jgi:membrane protein